MGPLFIGFSYLSPRGHGFKSSFICITWIVAILVITHLTRQSVPDCIVLDPVWDPVLGLRSSGHNLNFFFLIWGFKTDARACAANDNNRGVLWGSAKEIRVFESMCIHVCWVEISVRIPKQTGPLKNVGEEKTLSLPCHAQCLGACRFNWQKTH